MQFLLDRTGLSLLVERQNQGLPEVVDSYGMNRQFSLRFLLSECVKSPCKQITIRLLLFIKCGLSVGHGQFISAGKFLLGDHIKRIFLLRVHGYSANFKKAPSSGWRPPQASLAELFAQSVCSFSASFVPLPRTCL